MCFVKLIYLYSCQINVVKYPQLKQLFVFELYIRTVLVNVPGYFVCHAVMFLSFLHFNPFQLITFNDCQL